MNFPIFTHDRDGYAVLTLPDFGPLGDDDMQRDAAHVITEDGRLLGYVRQPADRNVDSDWDEQIFQAAVDQAVAEQWPGQALTIQFDPGSNQAEEITIDNRPAFDQASQDWGKRTRAEKIVDTLKLHGWSAVIAEPIAQESYDWQVSPLMAIALCDAGGFVANMADYRAEPEATVAAQFNVHGWEFDTPEQPPLFTDAALTRIVTIAERIRELAAAV